MHKVPVSLGIPAEVVEKVDEIAKAKFKTRADVIREVLVEHFFGNK